MEKRYYIELEPLEKKETTGYSGPDMVCAHFRSKHEPSHSPVRLGYAMRH